MFIIIVYFVRLHESVLRRIHWSINMGIKRDEKFIGIYADFPHFT